VKIPAGLLQEEEITLSTTEESLQKAAANDPRSQAIDIFNKAAGFINEKKYDEALDALKKSKELDPSIYQTHFYMGVVLFEKGNYKEAIQPLLDAIELKNDDGGPYRLLAAIYEKLGNKEDAAKYTKLAQEKGGKTAIDVFNEGIAAYNRNETDNALAAFQKAIELDANFADAYYYMGMCYLNKDMNDKAILNLKKYLELKPNGEEAESAKSILDSLQ
jgi:tetratricopeptide (TPR) repeat protein